MSVPSQKTILNQNYTRSGIYPRDEMNTLARMLNNIRGESGVRVDVTPYEIKISGDSDTGADDDFDFKTWANTTSNNYVQVYDSGWIRNGIESEIANETSLLVTCDGNDQYVIAEITSTTGKDPAIVPDTLTLSMSATKPADDEFNTKRLVATVATNGDSATVTSVFQDWLGGEVDDVAIVPDGETVVADAPIRNTIQLNTSEHGHKKELQLHDVANAYSSSTSIPYFTAGADAGSGKGSAGVLAWAALDTNLMSYDNESLELHTITGGVETGKIVLQIRGFETAASGGSSPAGADLVVLKNAAGQSVAYISLTDLLAWIDPFTCQDVYDCLDDSFDCNWISGCPPIEGSDHGLLINLDDCTHHDWAWTNDSVNCDTSYLRNYGESVGDLTPNLVIDLVNERLVEAAKNTTVDWKLCELTSPDADVFWDVTDGTIFRVLDTTGSTTKDTGALIVEGGVGIEQNAFIGGECQADIFALIDDHTNNHWYDAAFKVDVDVNAEIYAAGDITLNSTSLGTSDINLDSANKVVIETVDDVEWTIGGVNTVDGDACDVVLGDGVNSVFRDGWFVNQSSWAVMQIEVMDGSGGTKSVWTIGKDV